VSPKVIPLASIASDRSAEDMRKALAGRGCGAKSCAPKAGPDDMPAEVWDRIKAHPCYSEDAHHYFARIHVGVAPACNIQCHYCNRKYDCANESRPGVVSERLTPEDAVRKVMAVAAEVPQLSVVGIAGPGDALADHRRTFATFRLLAEKLPDLTFCLSTNGLALPDHVDEIKALGIHHVTVTLNTLDPQIGARIYAWVAHEKRRWCGAEAAKILLDRQIEGIRALVAAGILVKINSVMIPGVNDDHLVEVSAELKTMGVFLHNVMPLISDPAHGTHYGLTGQRGPTPAELSALQEKLSDGSRLMRHCRQCRADAVGLLGEDRSSEFTLDRIPDDPVVDPAPREDYRTLVEELRAERDGARTEAQRLLRAFGPETPQLVAVCTKGGGRINQHFGHASEFQIFEASRNGLRFIGHRRVDRYCQGGDGDDGVLDASIAALDGVTLVLCAKIGRCPSDTLKAAGIRVSDAHAFAYIDTGIAQFYRSDAGAEDRGLLTA
jgi:nitrogen fixation protein NifB